MEKPSIIKCLDLISTLMEQIQILYHLTMCNENSITSVATKMCNLNLLMGVSGKCNLTDTVLNQWPFNLLGCRDHKCQGKNKEPF